MTDNDYTNDPRQDLAQPLHPPAPSTREEDIRMPLPDRFMGRLRMEGVGACSDAGEDFWRWMAVDFRGGL